ncbi:MAG: hypothetical protein AAGI30_04695 [Planctomycetota bacterium]
MKMVMMTSAALAACAGQALGDLSYGEPVLEARSAFATGFNLPAGIGAISAIDVSSSGAIVTRAVVAIEPFPEPTPSQANDIFINTIEDALLFGGVGQGLGFVTRTGPDETSVIDDNGTPGDFSDDFMVTFDLVPLPTTFSSFLSGASVASDDTVLFFLRSVGAGTITGFFEFDPAAPPASAISVVALDTFGSSASASGVSATRRLADGSFIFVQGNDDDTVFAVNADQSDSEEVYSTADQAGGLPPFITFDNGGSFGDLSTNGLFVAVQRFEFTDQTNTDQFAVIERIEIDSVDPLLPASVNELESTESVTSTYSSFLGSPDVNSTGQVVYLATRRDNGLQELVLEDGSSQVVIITEGGSLDGVTIIDLGVQFNPRIGDSGKVVFFATDDQGTTGIWITDGTEIASVASLGCTLQVDDLTDVDGDSNVTEITREFVITSFSPNIAINANDTIVFTASDIVNGMSETGSSIFSIQPGVFSLADVNGDQILDADDYNAYLAALVSQNLDVAELNNDAPADAFDLGVFGNLLAKGF